MKNNKLAWMTFVSNRFASVDRKGRSALTSYLSSLGIAFGVMTLIVVMAVMNGFQLGYIESILELSSYHARVQLQNSDDEALFKSLVMDNTEVRSITPFYEEQALVVGRSARQQAAMLRFVPQDILNTDEGFSSQISLLAGTFDITDNKTVIGSSLARSLGVSVGDTINILAMSGSSDVDLFSDSRTFTISGVFSSDYVEINSTFMFFSLETGMSILGENALPLYGIKLNNSETDTLFLSQLQDSFEKNGIHNATLESWRSYNRAFFGALRVEKNLLMLLVFMIFIVVGVNIYNSMRRMVFERREDIAVLTALGSTSVKIQSIFIYRGFLIGFLGAIVGLFLGILISVNMDTVFIIISKVLYSVQYFFVLIFNSENVGLVTENPMFSFYAQIATRIDPTETTLITVFGLLSSLCASWIASRKILKLSAAEVLRYE